MQAEGTARKPYMPDSTRTFSVEVGRGFFRATLYLDLNTVRDDALPIASEFPKSYRVRASTLGTAEGIFAVVYIAVDLHPGRTKGSLNETGEARIRGFIEKAHGLGYDFEIRCLKSYTRNALTDEQQVELAKEWLGSIPITKIKGAR